MDHSNFRRRLITTTPLIILLFDSVCARARACVRVLHAADRGAAWEPKHLLRVCGSPPLSVTLRSSMRRRGARRHGALKTCTVRIIGRGFFSARTRRVRMRARARACGIAVQKRETGPDFVYQTSLVINSCLVASLTLAPARTRARAHKQVKHVQLIYLLL